MTLVCIAAGIDPAKARDYVTLPYSCEVDGGRVLLRPAAERRYAILGNREEQPVSACRSGDARDCRVLMVHRFAISCGGQRVAWSRIAAALPRSGAARIWQEHGRLGIELAPRRSALPRRCQDRPSQLSGPSRRDPAECLPWQRPRGGEQALLPAGFAPVGEFGARLHLGGETTATNAPETRDVAALPPVEREMLPEVKAVPAVLTAREHARNWNTVVRLDSTASEAERAANDASVIDTGTTRRFALWSLVLAAMAALTWMAAQHRLRMNAGFNLAALSQAMRQRLDASSARFRGAPKEPPLDDTHIANASHSVNALLTQARIAVGGLRAAAPLHEVLENELEIMRQRIAVVSASASADATAAQRAAPAFRALVRDLGRIRRIADSAAASLDGARGSRTVPRTRAEAFDLLGVNPDVSDATLKKLVDALRMSWHPDHARDDDDRELRDLQTKRINVAWDLIAGKRSAG